MGRTDENGLFDKYQVTRRDDPDRKHDDCTYFVLDLTHDETARYAAESYAWQIAPANPVLANELRRAVREARKVGG